jgi:hypothetical protein
MATGGILQVAEVLDMHLGAGCGVRPIDMDAVAARLALVNDPT